MLSLSSRIRRSESTTASGPSFSTPSMDIDTQLAPLPETRKRLRNFDLDSDDEEPQAQRVRVGDSNSIENVDSEMVIDTPAQNVMAPLQSRQSRIRSGRRTMSRQEQEQISSTFANIGAPTPAVTHSTPVGSPSRANHTVQASTTHQSHESTSQRRSYEGTSDYDADISGDERPRKVRHRGELRNSVHTPAIPIETHNLETPPPPVSDEVSVIGNQGSEAASSPVSSLLLAIEAPSNRIASKCRDTQYIDLTLEDSRDEEENDAALPPTSSVLPAIAALPEPTIKFQRLPEDARTQKLHCLDKWYSVGCEDDVEFSRQFAVLGTSCNVFVDIIEKRPNCDCYEGRRDILCVHIVFILTQFLNLLAPIRHQTTFLEAELRCMMGDEIGWMGPVSTNGFCTQKGQCGKNFHLQCIWTWADTNFQDGQPNITCGNCRAPWIWIGRQLAGFIEGAWNWQFGIHDDDAGYHSLSELLNRDVSNEGYFNVAEILGIYQTVEDDAEAHEGYQRVVDRWRAEMVRQPTTLLEEVYGFIVRYHPEVYIDAGDVFRNVDENSPRAIRVFETVDFVEMNVERVLQGLPTTDSEFTMDLHLL